MSYGTEVSLLGVTEVWLQDENGEPQKTHPTAFIEYAGRICYGSTDKLGANKDWVQTRIKQGHESILEHVSASFLIKCSRAVSHELVRHRIASFSQRSQRYAKDYCPKFEYIIPPELRDKTLFNHLMMTIQESYNAFISQGASPEIARYILPNAVKTEILMTMNFRELRHFIKLRTSPAALPEMREVATMIKELCMGMAPEVFKDL